MKKILITLSLIGLFATVAQAEPNKEKTCGEIIRSKENNLNAATKKIIGTWEETCFNMGTGMSIDKTITSAINEVSFDGIKMIMNMRQFVGDSCQGPEIKTYEQKWSYKIVEDFGSEGVDVDMTWIPPSNKFKVSDGDNGLWRVAIEGGQLTLVPLEHLGTKEEEIAKRTYSRKNDK